MVSENLIGLLDELQKFTVKIKIQQILDTLVKDERVHEVIDADKVFDYYNKMHEHFAKNPKDFIFPNREWVRESLKRINVDVSDIFDAGANVDHIKREEIIVLFMLLWIHMKVQDPSSSSSIEDPYILFHYWIYDRVFIARPTDTRYLQDGDRKVLDRIYDKYGWFIKGHCFTIGAKGAVEYHYSSPDDITNIDGAYNKVHGSVTKLRDINDWAMDHRTLYPKSMFRLEIDPEELKKGTVKLANDLLEEKQRRYKIARNTKFVVREMTDMSNREYKEWLSKYNKKEGIRNYHFRDDYDRIIKLSGLDIDNDIILDLMFVSNLYYKNLVNALLKLKEKLNEEKDQ